jgi:hypothetical protein
MASSQRTVRASMEDWPEGFAGVLEPRGVGRLGVTPTISQLRVLAEHLSCTGYRGRTEAEGERGMRRGGMSEVRKEPRTSSRDAN